MMSEPSALLSYATRTNENDTAFHRHRRRLHILISSFVAVFGIALILVVVMKVGAQQPGSNGRDVYGETQNEASSLSIEGSVLRSIRHVGGRRTKKQIKGEEHYEKRRLTNSPYHQFRTIKLCDGDPLKGTCDTINDCTASVPDVQSCEVVHLDPYQFVRQLYSSDKYNSYNDWFNNWQDENSIVYLTKPLDHTPNDKRAVLRGIGSIAIDPKTGEAHFKGRPRLFINKVTSDIDSSYDSSKGFDSIEFTAYAKIDSLAPIISDRSGITLVARTNWFTLREGCDAPAYYARISQQTGKVVFQKRYYLGTEGVVYSNSIETEDSIFDVNTFPIKQWIGMKFVVMTLPNSENVQLEFYIDKTNGMFGGKWTLVQSFLDQPGKWENNLDPIPEECSIKNGDTVLGPKDTCWIHGDQESTQSTISWKKVSIRNILPKALQLCGGNAYANPCRTDEDCLDDGYTGLLAKCVTDDIVSLDRFGIKKVLETDPMKSLKGDWTSTWDIPYTSKEITPLTLPGQQDPTDPRTSLRGVGTASIIKEQGELHMRYQTMLFISNFASSSSSYDGGWENVEFTAYGKLMDHGSGFITPLNGLEMVARSNYTPVDGCSAQGYVARLHQSTGQASFQKVYYDSPRTGKILSNTVRVNLFPNGLPTDVYIGMKFIVYTIPNTQNVQLQLYIDAESDGRNGGDWKLIHTLVDAPDTWMPWDESKDVKEICPDDDISNGDTVTGSRNLCFLRVNGTYKSVVSWKRASIRNILVPSS